VQRTQSNNSLTPTRLSVPFINLVARAAVVYISSAGGLIRALYAPDCCDMRQSESILTSGMPQPRGGLTRDSTRPDWSMPLIENLSVMQLSPGGSIPALERLKPRQRSSVACSVPRPEAV